MIRRVGFWYLLPLLAVPCCCNVGDIYSPVHLRSWFAATKHVERHGTRCTQRVPAALKQSAPWSRTSAAGRVCRGRVALLWLLRHVKKTPFSSVPNCAK